MVLGDLVDDAVGAAAVSHGNHVVPDANLAVGAVIAHKGSGMIHCIHLFQFFHKKLFHQPFGVAVVIVDVASHGDVHCGIAHDFAVFDHIVPGLDVL